MTNEHGDPEIDAVAAQSVRVELTVNASIERSFSVFTEECDSWWPREYGLGQTERVALTIEPRVGGRWYETGRDGSECDWGIVLAWEPATHLALSWMIAPGFRPEHDPVRASRVEVHFASDGPDRTIISLTHSDFERHGEGWESMRDGVAGAGGWPGVLRSFAVKASQ